jgi:hypothetical protein
MVDALIDEPADELKKFENRRLFLSQINDTWVIKGELDATTGEILNKALNDISDKLFHEADPLTRKEYLTPQRRADAIGYLAQGYVSFGTAAIAPQAEDEKEKFIHELKYTPPVSSDIVVTAADLNPDTTTKDFLGRILRDTSLIISTHSREHVKQILCDSATRMPVSCGTNKFDLGRSIRTAPIKLKKHLMLIQSTCSAPGCSTPAQWCDAHHIEHWMDGGSTNLDNLVLLCRRHHTMIHHDKTFEEKLNHSPPQLVPA